MSPRKLTVLIGASGSGKTSVARLLSVRGALRGNVFHFDDIGVPTPDEMRKWGGPERWQSWATAQWIRRLSKRGADAQLLEGQTRPSFIEAAIEGYRDLRADPILLDCEWEVRRERLIRIDRPELASEEMKSWAVFLRREMEMRKAPVIDTGGRSMAEVADLVRDRMGGTPDRLLLRSSPPVLEENVPGARTSGLDGDPDLHLV